MGTDRLTFAVDTGGLALPDEGRVACFGADPAALPPVAPDRLCVIDTIRPVHDALSRRGITCTTRAEGPCAAAIITLPRARALAQARIAEAVAATPAGLIIVDGAKTDGVDSILKAVKARVGVSGLVSKSHGKLFWFEATPVFDDWASSGPTANRDGYLTAPGVFSADGIDPASKALIQALPDRLGAHVADLGAGWGYLSANCLGKTGLEAIDLVEVDAAALDCAKQKAEDPRAAAQAILDELASPQAQKPNRG
jgi:16S rRNA (guanine1207-N2)-methyltransferase